MLRFTKLFIFKNMKNSLTFAVIFNSKLAITYFKRVIEYLCAAKQNIEGNFEIYGRMIHKN